jgi:hypothetical protein
MPKRAKRRGWSRKKAKKEPAKLPPSLEGLKQEALGAFARALDAADRDPDAFKAEAKRVARKFGVTVEEVYKTVKIDPSATKETVGNLLIRQFARAVKRELGIS